MKHFLHLNGGFQCIFWLFGEDSLSKIDKNHSFDLRYLGEVQVKGKKEPIGIYECLNGDAPEIAQLKLKTIPDFEKGLEHFLAKDFPQASALFAGVIKSNPNDAVAQLFLNKSGRYIHEGIPEDWTGVEVMTFK